MSEMKKRLQRKGARKGFTLVELLIVIIIIGILAGAMMMVAGGGRDAAEASKIISDLRTMKSAALMWMAENPTTVTAAQWISLEGDPSPINKYLDRPLISGSHPYVFKVQKFVEMVEVEEEEGGESKLVPGDTLGEAWILGYKLTDAREGVKSNLEKQAASAGLYGGTASGMKITDEWPPTSKAFYKATDGYVYVIVQ